MDKRRTKLAIVAGARPNFMKVAPIIRELQKYHDLIEWRLIHTGQHYDRDMSEVFFEELEIPAPDYHLDAGGGSHSEQTAKIMVRFEEVCLKEQPDLVLVVGDVNSTLACSIVAKKLNIDVAHVEAGLRSGDMRMPEEVNRLVTDAISDLFFVTEESAVANLMREGKAGDSIQFVGHVMVDNLYYQVEKLRSAPSHEIAKFKSAEFKHEFEKYGVVTLHRPSNVDDDVILRSIIDAFNEIANDIPLIFPAHPRTRKRLMDLDLVCHRNLRITAPLSYMDFLNLWKDATVVITDSGGLQEETTALGVPCITVRDNTERPITVDIGTNQLVGNSKSKILGAVKSILLGATKTGGIPPLWDGKAAVRIVEVLKCRGH